MARVVARPVRMEPERVERVDLVLRAERVDGVRPEPVRVDADAASCVLAVPTAEGELPAETPGAAIPQVSQ